MIKFFRSINSRYVFILLFNLPLQIFQKKDDFFNLQEDQQMKTNMTIS